MASLFDTGAFERLRRGDRAADSLSIRLFPPMICLHVAAEYFYGAAWSAPEGTDLQVAKQAIQEIVILQLTLDTAAIYAALRVAARRAGRQMPDPDFWIASHASEERVPLVTLDRHFLFFDELHVHLLA